MKATQRVLIAACLFCIVFAFGCSSGGSSNDDGGGNGGDGDDGNGGSSTIKNDGACSGPPVGTSPNDSDDTFRSLVVHPTDPNTILIGNEGNGIFKSTDGGAAWARDNAGLYYYNGSTCFYAEIYQLLYDDADYSKIYAATTGGPQPISREDTGGFYYSADGGSTWARSISGLHNYAVVSVAQDPSNPNVLYIGMDNAPSSNDGTSNTGPNMYKSIDGGLTWTGLTLPVTDNRITYIVTDPSNPNVIYCSGFNSETTDRNSSSNLGIAKSADGGATWTRINSGLTSLYGPSISIAPSNPNTLYATTWTDQGAATFKSVDGGETWASFPTDQSKGISNIEVSPFSSNTLIGYSTQKIYMSGDGGTTWSVSLDFSSDGTSMKKVVYSSDQNIVYAGANGLKVYKSTDGGSTFAATSGSIQTLIGH